MELRHRPWNAAGVPLRTLVGSRDLAEDVFPRDGTGSPPPISNIRLLYDTLEVSLITV